MDRRWGVCEIVRLSSKGWCRYQRRRSRSELKGSRESGDSSMSVENEKGYGECSEGKGQEETAGRRANG